MHGALSFPGESLVTREDMKRAEIWAPPTCVGWRQLLRGSHRLVEAPEAQILVSDTWSLPRFATWMKVSCC